MIPALPVTPDSVLVLRGCGPKGYPGMPEVANLPLPRKMLEMGVRDMVRVCDGRMSGTAYGTVVLHVAPEAAAGGLLALVQDGDPIVLDVPRRVLQLDVPERSWSAGPGADRHRSVRRAERGWPRLYVDHVQQADTGADLDFLVGASGPESPGSHIDRTGTATCPARHRRRATLGGPHGGGGRAAAGRPGRPASRVAREAQAAVEVRRCRDGPRWHPARAGGVPGGLGAGVTYERSRAGRIEESTEGGIYDRVYVARRRGVLQGDGRAGGRPRTARRHPRRLALERAGAGARPGTQRRR